MHSSSHSIAVLIPCYNEAPTIADVIASFQRALPSAIIYVYDNNSTDGTAAIAFSTLATAFALSGLVLGYPLVITYVQTGLVPRFPTAIIVIGLMIFAVIAFVSGIILSSIAQMRRENKRLNYLRWKALE